MKLLLAAVLFSTPALSQGLVLSANAGQFAAEDTSIESLGFKGVFGPLTLSQTRVALELGAVQSSGNTYGVAWRQEWNSRSTTELSYDYSAYDDSYSAHSVGLKHSFWVWEDTLQFLVGGNRVEVFQDSITVLRDDLREVVIPSRSDTNTATVGLSWLASPFLVLEGSLLGRQAKHEPVTKGGEGKAKVFVKNLHSALHLTGAYLTRSGNTDESQHGDMTSKRFEGAWVAAPWLGAEIVVSYRRYYETESLYEDRSYASDLALLSVAQTLSYVTVGAEAGLYKNSDDLLGRHYAVTLSVEL